MAYWNSGTIKGNLTRDAETGATQSGKYITKFSIAVNHGKEKVSYFSCVAFDLPDWIKADLKKGVPVICEYSLQQDRWEKDGIKNSVVKLICQSVQPIPRDKQEKNADYGNTAPDRDFFNEATEPKREPLIEMDSFADGEVVF